MSLSAALLPEFDHEMAGLRRTLERVPAAQWDWRPHPRSFTLGALAAHLATTPSWAVGTLATTALDFDDPAAMAAFPRPPADLDSALATFDQGVAEARAALAAASDADLTEVWSGRSGGKVLFAMPRMAVLRRFVLNHAVHHRGQLTVYLRLLDAPVPALYGPSADEAGA